MNIENYERDDLLNMKIEKLNENKIRITLNMDDLRERDIDFHSFMSNSIESQSIFLDILDTAEKEVGFRTNDCRIMIEALALKNSSFVLTITKFEHNDDTPSTNLHDEIKAPQKKKSLHIKRKSPEFASSKTIYSFDSFDSFCDFCTFLQKSRFKNQLSTFAFASDLYEYNSNYYLIFTEIDLNSEVIKFICPTITEFAHFVDNSELFEKKITEYGKPIIKETALTTAIAHFA